MDKSDLIYKKLKDDFGFQGAEGGITFSLKDFSIIVDQNNVVGNLIEEWLSRWMDSQGVENIHNQKQSSPDFWLNPNNLESEWLEIKSFTGSPNFDVSSFRSFIQLIIDKPYKLQSKYLLIKYKMKNGIVTIEDFWLKKIWEICSNSERFPIKVQYKNKVIVNIRPCVWYSDNTDYPPFECLEDFLSSVEETIYMYHDTRYMCDTWKTKVIESYKKHYGIELIIPRWSDIKDKYKRR